MTYPESYGCKKDRISYVHFRSCFTRLAAELDHPRKGWKSAFERRISPTFQKSLAPQFLDDSVDFATIAKLAQKVDYTNSVADAATRAKRAAEKDSVFTNKARLGDSSYASNSTGQNKKLENVNSPRKFPSASTPTRNQTRKYRIRDSRTKEIGKLVTLGQIDLILGTNVKVVVAVNKINEKSPNKFLHNLIDGKPWTINCTIINNGFSLTTTDALPDTGAGGYIFVNWEFAKRVIKCLNPKKLKNFIPSQVTGYDVKKTQVVDTALVMTLRIQGYEMKNVPFLIIDMKHDIILGRKWFEKHGVKIDCRKRQLIHSDKKLVTQTNVIPMDENEYQARNPKWNDKTKADDKSIHSKNQIENQKQLQTHVDNDLPLDNSRESEKEIRRSNRIFLKQQNQNSIISELNARNFVSFK
ncbi:hypothetical protein GcM3_083029 [Golovinomyces cichoracearum]|uniref:Uncharacterized protein n=1 Tax=Golovinomyces cichoracearum TaxID=62708 RepID=A0A420IM82_9PEZI|nr:hypothetical protein GcM3_083029 [Golovinomyces cichoracearum]